MPKMIRLLLATLFLSFMSLVVMPKPVAAAASCSVEATLNGNQATATINLRLSEPNDTFANYLPAEIRLTNLDSDEEFLLSAVATSQCPTTGTTCQTQLIIPNLPQPPEGETARFSVKFSHPELTCSSNRITVGTSTTDNKKDEGDLGQPNPIDSGVTEAVLNTLNPLKIAGTDEVTDQVSTPGGFLTRVLVFAFPLAGLILFVMIVWGGFEILSGATNKKSLDAGKQRISAAIIGFLLLFTSFWIARILEVMFGINIL
jgi:hypothetical protein